MTTSMNYAGLFPVADWLVGSGPHVEQALKQRALEWAAVWRAKASFPPVNLVPPGPIAPLLYNTTDDRPQEPRARLFANVDFVAEIVRPFNYSNIREVVMAYEEHVGESAWGSFEAILFDRWPHGMEAIKRRLQRIVPHLPVLEAVQVVDYDRVERSAASVVEREISSTLQNWDASDRGSLEARIAHALAEMERTDPDKLRERIVRSMLRLLPTIDRLRHRDALTAQRLHASLSNFSADELEELSGCVTQALVGELYTIDREQG